MSLGSLGLTGSDSPEEDPSEDSQEPSFKLLAVPASTPAVTFREAVMGSLLAHAAGVIFFLLAPPGLFAPAEDGLLLTPRGASDRDEAVPLAFIQDRPRPPEPNPDAPAASDRDRRRAQKERPENPSRAEPFSRGNTPAMIAQGTIAPPSPAPAQRPPTDQADAARDRRARAEGEKAEQAREGLPAREGTGPFYVAPPTYREGAVEGAEDEASKARRLRDTLAQMGAQGSLGGDGGSPYRFHNPVGGLDTPTGSLSFDTKGFDWGDYARRIYWIIWSNWHARMPPAIYTGQKGVVTVRFVIERDGTLSEIRILSGSGVPAYDSAASLALEASDPLPPLPEDFPHEREGVTGRFLYNMWREE